MLMAGIFCAIAGLEVEALLYVGGLFAAIGVVVAFMSEFGGGLVRNQDDEKSDKASD